MDGACEAAQVQFRCTEIVGAGAKSQTAGGGKQTLQRLGPGLDLLEASLLLGIPAVGLIPIAVIHLLATLGSGDAPMRHFVQGAGKIVLAEYHAVRVPGRSRRHVDGLSTAATQAGIVLVEE